MDDFIKVCKTTGLKNKIGKKIVTDDNTEIAVFKVDEEYFAVSNICPHNHSPLISEGFIDNDLFVVCPVHCYKFSLKTGMTPSENKEMSGKLEVYKTKVIGDELWVEKKKRKNIFNW